MRAMSLPLARPQSREELINSACARNFRICASNSSDRVGIASPNGNLSQPRSEPRGTLIGSPPHLAVPRFKGWHVGGKPAEVIGEPLSGQTRENMIHAEEQLFLSQVHHQRNEVLTPALDFNMVALGDSINA